MTEEPTHHLSIKIGATHPNLAFQRAAFPAAHGRGKPRDIDMIVEPFSGAR